MLDAIRFLGFVHLSTGSTRDVLAELRPRYYAKGADCSSGADAGVPDDEVAACAEDGMSRSSTSTRC